MNTWISAALSKAVYGSCYRPSFSVVEADRALMPPGTPQPCGSQKKGLSPFQPGGLLRIACSSGRKSLLTTFSRAVRSLEEEVMLHVCDLHYWYLQGGPRCEGERGKGMLSARTRGTELWEGARGGGHPTLLRPPPTPSRSPHTHIGIPAREPAPATPHASAVPGSHERCARNDIEPQRRAAIAQQGDNVRTREGGRFAGAGHLVLRLNLPCICTGDVRSSRCATREPGSPGGLTTKSFKPASCGADGTGALQALARPEA